MRWICTGNNVIPGHGGKCGRKSDGKKIWQNTGYLGWRIKSTSFNPCTRHLHGIGYPTSVADVPNTTGEMRQITGTGSTYPTNPVICILGTDWGKVSGGGPWVWKFGWKIDTNGNPVINDNRVVTVFSTIFPNSPPGLTLKGGSVFDARWSSLFQSACANDPGNCIQWINRPSGKYIGIYLKLYYRRGTNPSGGETGRGENQLAHIYYRCHAENSPTGRGWIAQPIMPVPVETIS